MPQTVSVADQVAEYLADVLEDVNANVHQQGVAVAFGRLHAAVDGAVKDLRRAA